MMQLLSDSEVQSKRLRDLEGHRVSLTIADGSQVDNVLLVSAGRGTVSSVWLDMGGMDVFLHHSQVLAAWDHAGGKAA